MVFVLSGLWHGADWTYLFWGLLHGVLLGAERALAPVAGRRKGRFSPAWTGTPARVFRILVTYHVVVLAWVFFRSENLGQAFHVVGRILLDPRIAGPLLPGLSPETGPVALLALAAVLAAEGYQEIRSSANVPGYCPLVLRWAAYSAALWGIILGGYMEPYRFIYFVF